MKTLHMSDFQINGIRQYCWYCCTDAVKSGRLVRLVKIDGQELEVCPLCESKARNGLIHYRPSNGEEFGIFESKCFVCRHHIDDSEDPQPGRLESPYALCTHGVLDRFAVQMGSGYDDISNWFDPQDLEYNGTFWPARCRRFTHKSDGDGETCDPAPCPIAGQLSFEDLLEVKERELVGVNQ